MRPIILVALALLVAVLWIVSFGLVIDDALTTGGPMARAEARQHRPALPACPCGCRR